MGGAHGGLGDAVEDDVRPAGRALSTTCLASLHLPGAHTTWLAGIWTSWATILVADAWKNVPFMAIILLAGLQVIPSEVYEAARIDGASAWQSFRADDPATARSRRLPVALIFRTLQAFLVFDVIYIMTGGGPGVSTETLSFLNWQTFLVEHRLRLRRGDLGDARPDLR